MLDQPAMTLLSAAATAGFDGVGLRLSGREGPDELARLARAAADRGIVIHDTEVHRHRPGGPDPTWLIEATAALGATALLMVSDDPDPGATTEAVVETARACRQAGTRLAIEYMAWVRPTSPAEALAMASAADCDVVVDVLHHHRIGAGPEELDRVAASGRLGWVQLCDAGPEPPVGTGDNLMISDRSDRMISDRSDRLIEEARHHRLPPGEGTLPLPPLLERVPAGTPISVEVQSDTLLAVPPVDRARRLHDAARSVLQR